MCESARNDNNLNDDVGKTMRCEKLNQRSTTNGNNNVLNEVKECDVVIRVYKYACARNGNGNTWLDRTTREMRNKMVRRSQQERHMEPKMTVKKKKKCHNDDKDVAKRRS